MPAPETESMADRNDEAHERVSQLLPEPGRIRWQPLRSGLVDLYRYDQQEFVFEDGRLLLRGNNGTGKSRVLALQLPFLLDGETAPHRLEPDGDTAKRVEWNLLMDRQEHRRGITWIEFGRRDEDGLTHYLTLGCSLSAVKGRTGVQKWFFITPKRVGLDVQLQENQVVLSKDRLKAAIAPDGHIHEQVDSWRQAVDQALFHLGARYKPLLDLLIELRKPQLSRNLDEGKLSGALTSALPSLSSQVVEPLAQAFRSLEEERAQLVGLQATETAAKEFLKGYHSYAAVAARRRAEALRRTHSAYERASRACAEAELAAQQAKVALELARQESKEAGEADADAATRLHTLQLAPAMDLVRELEQAEREAATAAKVHERAVAELAQDESKEASKRTALQATAATVQVATRTTADAHTRLQAEAAPLGLAADDDQGLWDRALDQRRKAARMLESEELKLAACADKLERAERLHHERNGALDAARDTESERARQSRAAGEGLVAAFAAWRPADLHIDDPETVLADLEQWLESPEGKSPVQVATDQAFAVAIGHVEQERAGLLQQRGQVRDTQALALAEQARLMQGGHMPPVPWPSRSRESEREGAPLWRLCDFCSGLPDEDCRGLEAALQASGLLDAWVTPTGEVLTTGTLDAALTWQSAVVEPSLDIVLLPLDQAFVPSDVVRGVLQRIGLGTGSVWVDAAGRYALGPMQGQWSKDAAEHIGETAREVARQKKLAELKIQLAELAEQLTVLDAALAACTDRERRVHRQSAERPDDAPVRQAALALRVARAEVAAKQQLVVEAQRALLLRRDEEAAQRSTRDALAHELGLQAWLGLARQLEAALQMLAMRAVEFFGARRQQQAAVAAQLVATAAHEEAAQRLHGARLAAAEGDAARRATAVARDTLREVHGAEAHAYLAQVEQAQRDVKAAHARREAAAVVLTAADRNDAAADAKLVAAAEKVGTTQAERDAQLGLVEAVATAGLLVVLDMPPVELPLSATRTVELARALEVRLESFEMDDKAWARVQDALLVDLEQLRRALLEQRLNPEVHTLDDLQVVEVLYGDTRLRVPELRIRLRDEVRLREATLTEQERTVIENHLIGDLATELHDLIHRGERLVGDMSREVEKRATSTGMKLRFEWRLRDDVGETLAEARKRLMRKGATWTEQDRDLIARFLKGRLDDVRNQSPDATWQEQIERAFDYRQWHAFVVERHQDGQWKALTRRTHGTGSGGEKAIALTIPQLAAAAAYYRGASPLAPRLILLDEAFVGIDNDMRAKCMGLFADFDLDFVMTSEREWGCYATLPGVAICQLVTMPGVDAIDVVRWTWNSHERKQS